jgi:hypothetical protein
MNDNGTASIRAGDLSGRLLGPRQCDKAHASGGEHFPRPHAQAARFER